MKRIALILTLIGLVFTACSTAPVAEPDPVPGVIDLMMFPEEIVEVAMWFMCYSDDFGADVYATIQSPGTELDLDLYRPHCEGVISSDYAFSWYPQALLDAGFDKLTGPLLADIQFYSEDEAWRIYPAGFGDLDEWVVFYANSGGLISFEETFPRLISTLMLEEGTTTITMNVSYNPGWNLLYQTFEEIDYNNDHLTIDIAPLNTIEWDLHGLL